MIRGLCRHLLAAVAAAHAFVGRFARVAFCAGFNLNGIQRAVFLVAAMVSAAGYTAADIRIRFLLRHDPFLPKILFAVFSILILSSRSAPYTNFTNVQFIFNFVFT